MSLDRLETPVARALLGSTIPARFAFTARDGSPRVVPLWFEYVDGALVFATFPGTFKLAALRDGDPAAASIDRDAFPYQGLQVRGPLAVEPTSGIVPEYASAARRYLGDEAAAGFLASLGEPAMTRLTLRIEHVKLLDMAAG